MTRFEVTESQRLTGRGPWVVGQLRSGELAAGVVLGIGLHPEDAGRVRAGTVLVSPEGVR
ncbi:hypothetical protein [Modestobacter sp. Leaf380]|uniref:hypothetical protein n=1 Tax=Modestobacter sp. Leaf380 TaxID=1736356 RepID=UPI0006F887A4|nr:hypothetical protein [Modestobacter sp. Leaf380]KQS73724.1 hypothetical protein ASG41_03795 [Modestobacter sp. Leaf380]